jgi:hypothetical protein
MALPRPHKFTPRVRVISSTGDHIYTVHAEEAARMVGAGQAATRGGRRRVAEIELQYSLFRFDRKPCSPPSLRQYMGQRYTRREEIRDGDNEVVAYLTQLKRIDPRDRAIFRLSVTDCISSGVAGPYVS